MSEVAKVIAIDGPSGSGKSTLAKMVARKLNLVYLDTGAMFRALGVVLEGQGLDFTKPEFSKEESQKLSELLDQIKFEYGISDSVLIRLNEIDLTDKIREHHVSYLASQVSKFPEVRNYLKKIQRQIASQRPSVLEGRDIGTVIFPNAALKFFLTASSEVRAQRRYDQLVSIDPANQEKYSIQGILQDIEKRDEQDAAREVAPLKKAADAIEIDTTSFSIEEVLEQIIAEFQKRRNLF